MTQDTRPLVRVVAGIVLNDQGEYLLSSRPEGKPYAGYWEFAGGKVEAGEGELQALQREFAEELGITIRRATPWLTKVHSYEHAHVHLRFFWVNAADWSGELQAKEGQTWSWQKAGDFTVSPMLPANGPLLKALSVPRVLQGRLKTGLYGENAMGEYRVAPYDLAEPQHRHILISEQRLRQIGKMPEADSVWVVIQTAAQWPRIQDADVAVWQVQTEQAAREVSAALAQGVSLPLVVAAAPDWAARCREAWLAAGAHAVLLDDETEAV
ncbi:8-oxo-dGTP diphosphatase [Neisseria perflava]|uniref:NUDIX domain-containing protein n=1 Tax=Neisseria perflava TaxID=33053 RepID=UPI00209DA1B6|nr:NUDIX domain-containing protein [Neisseria perflava]MCP1771916.1 8-oxo-dGTP diphosphatase [Neisseria perflava]